MPTHQKPPPGLVFNDDYKDPETGTVIPGIASLLGITPSTFRKWRLAGKGPVTFIHGKKIAARKAAIDEYFVRLEREAEQGPSYEMRDPEPRVIAQRRVTKAA